MQPRTALAFWAASAHCWPISSPPSTSTPKSFRAGLLSICSSPASVDTRVCPIPGAAPALGLIKPHESTMGPLLQLIQVPLDGILSSGVPTTPPSLVSSANMTPMPLSMSITKVFNTTGANEDPWETPLVTAVHQDFELLITTECNCPTTFHH